MGFYLVQHPLIFHKLSKLRDAKTSVKEFRELLSEIGVILAVEATKEIPLKEVSVLTPLEETTGYSIDEKKMVLVPILRAGLGLMDGFLSLTPSARVGHIGIYRDEKSLQPNLYYFKMPRNLESRRVYVIDPMLATGGSSIFAVDQLKKHGARNIACVFLLASPEGVAALQKAHPDIDIFTAAVDRELNSKGFILPGLGDAGDRFFGTDIKHNE